MSANKPPGGPASDRPVSDPPAGERPSAASAASAAPAASAASPPDERLVVGLVRGFHGLRGTVRVEVLSDRAEDRFAAGRRLFVEGTERALTIAEAGPDEVGWRLRFEELPDRTAAESLRGVYLEAIVGPAERLARGEYYWHEVIGAAVTDLDGTALGEVVDLYRAGGAEVLLVRGPRGELDVPVVRPIVRIFAPRRGEIVVDGEALGLRGEDRAEDVARGEEGGEDRGQHRGQQRGQEPGADRGEEPGAHAGAERGAADGAVPEAP